MHEGHIQANYRRKIDENLCKKTENKFKRVQRKHSSFVSLLRNLRILGNWVQLFDNGKA